jgi:hypothetical protein
MQRYESIASAVGWETAPIVERDAKWGGMRLNENVWDGKTRGKIGSLTSMAGILMVPDIEPWPSVECYCPHCCGKVGWKIVAHPVPLIGRAPKLLIFRLNCE